MQNVDSFVIKFFFGLSLLILRQRINPTSFDSKICLKIKCYKIVLEIKQDFAAVLLQLCKKKHNANKCAHYYKELDLENTVQCYSQKHLILYKIRQHAKCELVLR